MNATQTMSAKRLEIIEKLRSKQWFVNTDRNIQAQLLALPEDAAGKDDWNGYLEDLANRPESLGGVTQLRITQVLSANYGVITMFEVQNPAGGVFTYEYFSWKHGAMSGSKGVVFVRTNDVITHFIVLRGDKFAPAQVCWDTTGGFADLGAEGVFTIPERNELEIKQELGSADIEVARVYDLGRIMTDAGQTNNSPGVFAAVIDAHNASKVDENPVNSDFTELQAGAHILPLSELNRHVMVNGDTFFQTAILRSVAQGIIPASVLAPSE